MRVAIIGRTQMLYDSALALAQAGHAICGVLTAPAAPEYTRTEADFERLAERFGCPYLCARSAASPEALALLSGCDIGVSMNWVGVLGPEVLDLFPLGVLNAHPGELPRYRGNACPNWAILRGEERLGLSIHVMRPGELDCGRVVHQDFLALTPEVANAQVWTWLETAVPQGFVAALASLGRDPGFTLFEARADDPQGFRGYPRLPVGGWTRSPCWRPGPWPRASATWPSRDTCCATTRPAASRWWPAARGPLSLCAAATGQAGNITRAGSGGASGSGWGCAPRTWPGCWRAGQAEPRRRARQPARAKASKDIFCSWLVDVRSIFLYQLRMLTELFTSKTRIRLLLKLFLNPGVSCYIRELATEFDVSPNAIKTEMESLSSVGYLEKTQRGRSVFFQANTKHPFFPEISSIVRKTLGIDRLIDDVLASLGQVEAVYILDDYAQGKDSGIIDLLVVGDVDKVKLEGLKTITEGKIRRRIRFMAISRAEFDANQGVFLNRPNWKVI